MAVFVLCDDLDQWIVQDAISYEAESWGDAGWIVEPDGSVFQL